MPVGFYLVSYFHDGVNALSYLGVITINNYYDKNKYHVSKNIIVGNSDICELEYNPYTGEIKSKIKNQRKYIFCRLSFIR